MKTITFGLCLCASTLSVVAQNKTQRPNIIVLLADDQGWGDLSVCGNRMVKTPNIDRLAAEGASFVNYYVCPVSAPTRAEFLTGRYAYRGQVTGVSEGRERLNLDRQTIGDYFKAAGYHTGAFGKWHNGTQYPYHPNARGFDEFYGYCSGHWGNYMSPLLENNGEIVYGEGFLTDDLTNHAISYIKDHQKEPFFVYLPFNTPHSPMQVTDKWWNSWKNRELTQCGTNAEKEDKNHTRAALALAENIDWNVGRVMQTLKELDIDDNTIVLYFSDNGPNSSRWNGEMKGTKGTTDEGGVRSPLFIRWPKKIKAGAEIEQLSGCIDLLPTLLSLSGNKTRLGKIDGIDLSECLTNENKEVKRTLYRTWGAKSSFREGAYLLSNELDLYNVREDRTQKKPIQSKEPLIYQQMLTEKEAFDKESLLITQAKDTRPFLIAHPKEQYSKLPARDGLSNGNIKRSNQYPNSSYFTNWISIGDAIYWDVEVCESGTFEAIVYYTCPKGEEGSLIRLSSGNTKLVSALSKANGSLLIGKELDRVPRQESYMQNFQPFSLGRITLSKGKTQILLDALDVKHNSVMDFYLLVFKRIK